MPLNRVMRTNRSKQISFWLRLLIFDKLSESFIRKQFDLSCKVDCWIVATFDSEDISVNSFLGRSFKRVFPVSLQKPAESPKKGSPDAAPEDDSNKTNGVEAPLTGPPAHLLNQRRWELPTAAYSACKVTYKRLLLHCLAI